MLPVQLYLSINIQEKNKSKNKGGIIFYYSVKQTWTMQTNTIKPLQNFQNFTALLYLCTAAVSTLKYVEITNAVLI